MSEIKLDFKFDSSAIQAQFEKLAKAGQGRNITRKIAGVLGQESEKAFDNEQSPEGEKWSALNPKWKALRHRGGFKYKGSFQKQGYTGPMLQMSGELKTSLSTDYNYTQAWIGTEEPYGAFHQEGTNRMPARPFIGIGERGLAEITHILERELKKIFV